MIYSFVIFIVGLCCVPFIWNDWFFGKRSTTIAEKFKYIGAFVGGLLLLLNAYAFLQQAKEQNRSNNLVAKGQLDTRFKDAATLLAAGNTSAELSAIHTLHQIAIEASKTENQRDYVRVIKDILIAFIKENSVIEYEEKDENRAIAFSKGIPCIGCIPNIKEAYSTKSYLVVQTIIDKLFRNNGWEIYAEYPTDLSSTVLKEIDFSKSQLHNVNFSYANLQNANFF